MDRQFKFLIFSILYFFIVPCQAATLLEVNWDNGTGTSFAAISSGVYTTADGSGTGQFFEVFSDDGTVPGDRNFLRIYDPTPGSGWLRGHTSFDGPTELYIRFWWRLNTETFQGSHHDFILSGSSDRSSGDGGNGFWPGRVANSNGTDEGQSGLTMAIDCGSTQTYRLGPYADSEWRTLPRGEWHLVEFHLINNAGANDYIYARINGVDVTDDWYAESSPNEFSDVPNGSFDLNLRDDDEMNYFSINTYDKTATKTIQEDVAGLMITDGPDWIGDGSAIASQGFAAQGVTIQ